MTTGANRRRLARIRCLLFDVDGVLTDGKLHFTSDGQEFKTFDALDGHGIAMAQRAGLLIGFVSGRPSAATKKRADDLGVKIVKQSPIPKWEMVEEIKREQQLADDEIAFVGDELVDLPVLRRAGFAVAVRNAVPEVKAVAHYITKQRGGDGAVREVIEMILKARNLWRKATAQYLITLAVAMAGLSGVGADPVGYVEKFEVPEHDEHGKLKWRLTGDRGHFGTNGLITIINARIEMYRSNQVTAVFTTPHCVFDRAANRAHTEQALTLEAPHIRLTGTGGDWDAKTSVVNIHSNVQVILKSAAATPPPP